MKNEHILIVSLILIFIFSLILITRKETWLFLIGLFFTVSSLGWLMYLTIKKYKIVEVKNK